jgi:2-methylisocitrate lyase-like PEP mutase family enzyme
VDKAEQARQAEAFRSRHKGPRLLLLPNAWDAASARIFAETGFEAVATTSGGVAWALGYADGEAAPWGEVAAATARIVRAAGVPVTADIEAGYAATPAQVAANVADIIGTGVVGLNLEDSHMGGPAPIRPLADAAERIRAAREAADRAGVPIVINARVDLYIRNIGEGEARFAETVERAKAYLAAGADCIYPIGLRDPAVIGRLVKAIAAPVNIMVRAGLPSVAELESLGVARASTATAISLAAMSLVRDIARSLRETGRFDRLDAALSHAEAQRLFAGGC